MPALKPEDCDLLIAQYINAGDVEAIVDLYEPTATFVAEPGKPVVGLDAIRGIMTAMVAGKSKVELTVPTVIQNGDVALLIAHYTATNPGPDGQPQVSSGRSTEVVRRQPDGTWRFMIDNPHGTS